MENDKQNLNNGDNRGQSDLLHQGGGPWWKPAMQIFNDISTWIIVPIVLALVLGKMLDKHFGTKPVIFLCFAGAGFLVTCFGIFRVMKNYLKKLKDIEDKNIKSN